MKKTPFSLLLSGITLILFGWFLVRLPMSPKVSPFISSEWSPFWGWFLVCLGVISVVGSFVWVKNLDEGTRRKLMSLSPTARKLFWPFPGQLSDKTAKVDARDDRGETALMRAADLNSMSIVKALITGGADVNAKDRSGRTALMRASAQNNQEVVKLLKKAGARE